MAYGDGGLLALGGGEARSNKPLRQIPEAGNFVTIPALSLCPDRARAVSQIIH